jgi:hypothetical protein
MGMSCEISYSKFHIGYGPTHQPLIPVSSSSRILRTQYAMPVPTPSMRLSATTPPYLTRAPPIYRTSLPREVPSMTPHHAIGVPLAHYVVVA